MNDDAIVSAVAMQAAPCKEHRDLPRAMAGWEEKKCYICLRIMLVAVCHDEREACANLLEEVALTQPETENGTLLRAAGLIRGRGKNVGEGGVDLEAWGKR